MSRVLVLSERDVMAVLTIPAVTQLVEAAFGSDAAGGSSSFPVVREILEAHSGIFGVKSGMIEAMPAVGLPAATLGSKQEVFGRPTCSRGFRLTNPSFCYLMSALVHRCAS